MRLHHQAVGRDDRCASSRAEQDRAPSARRSTGTAGRSATGRLTASPGPAASRDVRGPRRSRPGRRPMDSWPETPQAASGRQTSGTRTRPTSRVRAVVRSVRRASARASAIGSEPSRDGDENEPRCEPLLRVAQHAPAGDRGDDPGHERVEQPAMVPATDHTSPTTASIAEREGRGPPEDATTRRAPAPPAPAARRSPAAAGPSSGCPGPPRRSRRLRCLAR